MSLLILLRSTKQLQPPVPTEGLEEIPLYEEADDLQGQFGNYDCYDAVQRTQLHKQQHVNLRSMVDDDIETTIPMLYLDLLPASYLEDLTMDDLERTTLVRAGERWTNGTVAADPARNNWRVLSISCSSGANFTQSVFEI